MSHQSGFAETIDDKVGGDNRYSMRGKIQLNHYHQHERMNFISKQHIIIAISTTVQTVTAVPHGRSQPRRSGRGTSICQVGTGVGANKMSPLPLRGLGVATPAISVFMHWGKVKTVGRTEQNRTLLPQAKYL